MLPVLDVLHRYKFLSPLVLQPDDLPRLLEVAVLVVHLAVGLVQRLRVVDPVRTSLVHHGKQHLIRVRAAELWHNSLKSVLVSNHDEAARSAHLVVS